VRRHVGLAGAAKVMLLLLLNNFWRFKMLLLLALLKVGRMLVLRLLLLVLIGSVKKGKNTP
jgi:hypothetical protein